MALVSCVECGKSVSSGALLCPYCGKRDPATRPGSRLLLIVALGFILGLVYVFTVAFGIQKEPEAKPEPAPQASNPKVEVKPQIVAANEPKNYLIHTCRLADGGEGMQSNPCAPGTELTVGVYESGTKKLDVLNSNARTRLSKMANVIANESQPEYVIKRLGPPTWVTLPTDKDELNKKRGTYRLYWRNSPCSPISMHFDFNSGLDGVDAGFNCDGDTRFFEETFPKYSCDLPDRAVLCRRFM